MSKEISQALHKAGYLSKEQINNAWNHVHQAAWSRAVHELRTDMPHDHMVIYAENQPMVLDIAMAACLASKSSVKPEPTNAPTTPPKVVPTTPPTEAPTEAPTLEPTKEVEALPESNVKTNPVRK